MTTPPIDPRLVHGLTGQVAFLHQHLGRLGHDLGVLHQQLAAAQQQMPVQQAPVQQVPVQQVPVQHMPQQMPRHQTPTQQRPTPPFRPTPAPVPTTPWWQRDGVVSRLLAVAGAAVTVIGVVMLVVLAAQSGWFGPVPRVAVGALLSASLVVVAHRVVSRPGGRVGAVALAATGFAGLYLDIAAVTALYGWIHPVVGLTVGLVIASIGVAVASRWSSQPLAVLAVTGIAVLAPVTTSGLTSTLLAFLLIVQIAASPVDVREHWVWLRVARTVPVVVAILAAGFAAHLTGAPTSETIPLLVVAVVSFVAATAAWNATLAARPVDATSLAAVAATAGAVVVTASLFSRPVLGIVDASVAAAAVGLLVMRRTAATPVRLVLAGVASAAGAAAVIGGAPESVRAVVLVIAATGLLAVASRLRSRIALGCGSLFAVLGLADHMQVTSVDALTTTTGALAPGWVSVPTSIAIAIMGVAGVAAAIRIIEDPTARALGAGVAGVVGLFGLTATTVVVGVEIAARTGFLVGHGVATILWMMVAVLVLVRGLSNIGHSRVLLAAGLTVAGAATTKLFLFDLGALGGLPRAAAFLVVGVMLLGIGTRYARAFADESASGSAGTATGDAGEREVR